MNAKLVCTDAVSPVSEVVLDDAPIVFGRSVDADVRLCDTCTSRFHCQVDVADNRITVRDLGSSNGTLVNGETIQTAALDPGDALTVGISTFELIVEEAAYASAASAGLEEDET